MKLGFTGTRNGLSGAQTLAVKAFLLENFHGIESCHMGCCIGADTEFAVMAYEILDDRHSSIKGYPCDIDRMTSKLACMCCDEIHQPQPPLARNRAIVAACDVLLACPKESAEVLRSGTWATIRAGKRAGKRVLVILPDGTVEETGAA